MKLPFLFAAFCFIFSTYHAFGQRGFLIGGQGISNHTFSTMNKGQLIYPDFRKKYPFGTGFGITGHFFLGPQFIMETGVQYLYTTFNNTIRYSHLWGEEPRRKARLEAPVKLSGIYIPLSFYFRPEFEIDGGYVGFGTGGSLIYYPQLEDLNASHHNAVTNQVSIMNIVRTNLKVQPGLDLRFFFETGSRLIIYLQYHQGLSKVIEYETYYRTNEHASHIRMSSRGSFFAISSIVPLYKSEKFKEWIMQTNP